MIQLTACLIVYKRQRNMGKIIDSLVKWPFISEVLIRDNSKCQNLLCYGRYALGDKAENDYIYTQDDDCVLKNIDQLYEAFTQDPSKIAHSGTESYSRAMADNVYPICSEENRNIIGEMKISASDKQDEIVRRSIGAQQMAMAGWGMMLDKRHIRVLDRYIAKYGRDRCFYRETDRILSMLLCQRHTFVLGNIEHLDGYDTAGEALCKEKDHVTYKQLAIERCIKLCTPLV